MPAGQSRENSVCICFSFVCFHSQTARICRHVHARVKSGKTKERKVKLWGLDIFQWGRALRREWGGEGNSLAWISRILIGISPGLPEELEREYRVQSLAPIQDDLSYRERANRAVVKSKCEAPKCRYMQKKAVSTKSLILKHYITTVKVMLRGACL